MTDLIRSAVAGQLTRNSRYSEPRLLAAELETRMALVLRLGPAVALPALGIDLCTLESETNELKAKGHTQCEI